MSEDISAGVKILLERGKTNPEELTEEYGKWHQLRDAVYAYKEDGQRRAWIRGLRDDEINLLYEMFSSNARQIFDDYVMKTVLGAEDDEAEVQRKLAHSMAIRNLPINNPGMFRNSIQPGGLYATSVTDTSTTSPSIIARLKQELGIK